jgi:membrane protein
MSSIRPSVPLESYAQGVQARSLPARLAASARYLFTTESHVYAMAVAGYVLISFVPFTILLLTFSREVLRWDAATAALLTMLRDALPSDHDFITRNLLVQARSHKAQILSVAVLVIASSGVMLALEVALNRIWGFARNRSYIRNQIVSYLLALACGILIILSVMLTAANLSAIDASFGRLGLGAAGSLVTFVAVKMVALPTLILVFFLLYYFLPNGRVPLRPVVLSAIFAGLILELTKHAFILLLPWMRFRELVAPFYISVTILMYAFIGAMVLLAGAHFAAHGFRAEPQAGRATPGAAEQAAAPARASAGAGAGMPAES